MGKRRPFYRCGSCGVIRCYDDYGKLYYTVVNFKLEVHRHANDSDYAIMLCKAAGKLVIKEYWDDYFKNAVKYLIFGDEKYK